MLLLFYIICTIGIIILRTQSLPTNLNFDLYLLTSHLYTSHLYFNQILKKEWVSFAKISLNHQGTHLHNGIKKSKDMKILKNLNRVEKFAGVIIIIAYES